MWFKKLKHGNVHRYVYYKCTKGKDSNCKAEYIEEKDLVRQFEKILEEADLNEISIKERIKKEILRFKKFQKVLLGINDSVQIQDIDVKNYTRFILREGDASEKRELMGCFMGKIFLNNKKISLKP